MKTTQRYRGLILVLVACTLGLLLAVRSNRAADTGAKPQAASPGTQPSTQPSTRPVVKIDLDEAVEVKLPPITEDLAAVKLRTPDGKEGWAVRLPGSRPIATPAFAEIDGKPLLFVGGGYGSHEFYALDADTGKVVWKMQTGDDGPSAAVVETHDGVPYVAYNTESCTVIVADARTGKVIWQEWLGDPLMSQPAIADGKLYIAYPGGSPRGVQPGGDPAAEKAANPNLTTPTGVQQAAGPAPVQAAAPAAVLAGKAQTAGPAKERGHRLLCADLRTGKHLWEQDISGDVISAPVIDGSRVLLTCFDGTSFCLKCDDGAVAWKKEHSGTSAPLVADGHVVVTQKVTQGGQSQEGIKRLDPSRGGDKDKLLLAGGEAKYLKAGAEGSVAGFNTQAQKAQDSTVGFAAAPAAAGLAKAQSNVNVGTVAGGWAYQGARAAYANGQLLNAQANRFNCVRSVDGTVAWQAEAVGKGVTGDVQAFAPPALGKENLYVCSAQGHLIAMGQKDGKPGFLYATGQPMAFQPALAKGNLYAATTNGMVICLKTGNPDADGWTAWGGNARHNKK